MLNARRSYAGEVADLILSGQNDVNLAVVPYYWDLVGRVDWTPTADDEVFLTFFAAKDRMELVFPDEDLGSTDVSEATDAIDFSLQFHRWILGWNSDLASTLRNELRLGVGTTDQRGNTFGFFRFESTAPVRNVRDQLTWRASDHVVLNGGLDLIWAPVDYDVEVVGYPQSLDAKTFSDLGTYLNAELRPTERLTLIPGLMDMEVDLVLGGPGAGLSDPVRLDPVKMGVGFTAYLTVGLGEHSKRAQEAFERAIARSPEVRECHNVTGTVEYLLRVEVADLAAYKVFHTDVLGTLPQVSSLVTYVVMGSPKDERA